MHNGGIGNWKKVKRQIAASVGDEWFGFVKGSTDSEWAFALFLDSLDKMGHKPSRDPGERGFGHVVLRKALLKTIERINDFTDAAASSGNGIGEDGRSLLNFAVTDGESIVCSRYVSSKTDEPASLFFSSGTSWEQRGLVNQNGTENHNASKGDYKMERRDKGSDIILVASEPLTFERGKIQSAHVIDLLVTILSHDILRNSCTFGPLTYDLLISSELVVANTNFILDNWVTVPPNSTLTIHRQTILVHPIIDQYHSSNPSQNRSIQFAQTKGQTVARKHSNESQS